MDFEIIKSQRGKPVLIKNGHMYNVASESSKRTIWRCKFCYKVSHRCPARIHTTSSKSDLQILRQIGDHEHEPSTVECDVKKATASVREEASVSSSSPSKVVASRVRNLNHATKSELPLLSSLRNSCRTTRRKNGGKLVIPRSRADINLPDDFRTTYAGDQFLKYDSGPSDDRMLIFTTDSNLNFLKWCDTWLVDGTFKSSPSLFSQLFVIHGLRRNTTVPLVYVLTPRRDSSTYNKMLEQLKVLNGNLRPSYIMSDFEMAFIKAFQFQFPFATQSGCYFHFCQAVLRKTQQLSIVWDKYSTDADFYSNLRLLRALAFVKPADVVQIYELLIQEDFFRDNAQMLSEFLLYFERTWVGVATSSNSRRPPMFPVELWNCFDSVCCDRPKTNNSCEGFHNAFASILGGCNPTIYKLVEGLKDKQALVEVTISQLELGREEPKSKKYAELANVLKSVVALYDTEEYSSPITYLRRVSHIMSSF